MQKMKVKPGYKMTELGVIPEDWDVKSFDDVFDITAGGDVKKEYFSNIKTDKYKYPIFANAISNKGIYGYSSVYDYISPSLTITARGGIGYAFPRYENYCAIVRLLVLHPKLDVSVSLISDYVNKYANFANESTGVPQLTKPQVSKYNIIYPKPEEQKLISQTLSDTDDLINSLDDLIEKKENIKEGTMQELLTGKRRLPGFDGEWVEKKLGDIGNTYGGLSGKNSSDFENGVFPYITFLNVMNNIEINLKQVGYVNIKQLEVQNQAKKGDLFFNTSSETPEEVGMCAVLNKNVENLYLNSFCFGYRLKKENEIHGTYMSYYINSDLGRKLFYSLGQGATRYNLSKTNFNNIKLKFPHFEEQKAISEFLSDIDNEIGELKTKRDKYKEIKEGMMQELLTGKTRLV